MNCKQLLFLYLRFHFYQLVFIQIVFAAVCLNDDFVGNEDGQSPGAYVFRSDPEDVFTFVLNTDRPLGAEGPRRLKFSDDLETR